MNCKPQGERSDPWGVVLATPWATHVDRRWLVWTVYFVCLTALLVMPGTVQEQIPLGEFVLTYKALIAKFVHVALYVVFAVLTARLPVAIAYRLPLLFLLMVHGALTEFIQQYVPQRVGSVSDVLFDHLGIALGLLISWKWWTRPET